MEGKTLARIGAVIFIAVALTMTAIELTRTTNVENDIVVHQIESPSIDPLRVELARCQGLGEAGSHDSACLKAWATARERFLKPAAKSADPELAKPQANTTIINEMPNIGVSSQREGTQ